MEFTKTELAAVRDVAVEVKDHVTELNELELMLVGGGTGDVQFG
jgi:hypothetical protein